MTVTAKSFGRVSPLQGCFLTALLILAALAAFLYRADVRHDRLENSSARVHLGMSRAQALAVMGTPSWESACGRIAAPVVGCASEIGYSTWLAPLLPVYWVIQLNRDDRVIFVYGYVSP